MKKTFLFVLLVYLPICAFADDVITLVSSQQVNCTIVETSESVIRYATNDGIFELPISDIRSIKYSSGKEQVFNAPATRSTSTNEEPSSSEYLPYRGSSSSNYVPYSTKSSSTYQPYSTTNQTNTALPLFTAQPTSTSSTTIYRTSTSVAKDWPKHPIECTQGIYYMDDKRMETNVYKEFLRINCPTAYKKYKSGAAAGWTGLCFGSVGFALTIAGTLYYTTGQSEKKDLRSYSSPEDVKRAKNDIDAGKLLLEIGVPLLAGGIILMSWGFPAQDNAYKVYNNSLRTPTTTMHDNTRLRLNVITHGNDLGLALAF